MRPAIFATAVTIAFVSVAAAQTPSAPQQQQSAPPSASQPPAAQPDMPNNGGGGTASAPRKRVACRQQGQAKGLRGEALRNDMKVCLLQARLDCLKEAIAKNTPESQQRDYIKSCMGRSG